MFKVRLGMVPPGGGEADYALDMMMPALPREGDYISVVPSDAEHADADHVGSQDFIVRRIWWSFDYPYDGKMSHVAGEEPVGNVTQIAVECEFASGPFSSKAHRAAAGSKARVFEASAY